MKHMKLLLVGIVSMLLLGVVVAQEAAPEADLEVEDVAMPAPEPVAVKARVSALDDGILSQSYNLKNLGSCTYPIGNYYPRKYYYYNNKPMQAVQAFEEMESCKASGGKELKLHVAAIDQSYIGKRYGQYPLGYVPRQAMSLYSEPYMNLDARGGWERAYQQKWNVRYGTFGKPSLIYGVPEALLKPVE